MMVAELRDVLLLFAGATFGWLVTWGWFHLRIPYIVRNLGGSREWGPLERAVNIDTKEP